MKDDPTITRIRNVRRHISEQYHHDAARLIAHYIELEQRHQDRVIERVTRDRDEGKTQAFQTTPHTMDFKADHKLDNIQELLDGIEGEDSR